MSLNSNETASKRSPRQTLYERASSPFVTPNNLNGHKSKGGRSNENLPQVDELDMGQSARFIPSKGQHPALGIKQAENVERDAHGQPLSPKQEQVPKVKKPSVKE